MPFGDRMAFFIYFCLMVELWDTYKRDWPPVISENVLTLIDIKRKLLEYTHKEHNQPSKIDIPISEKPITINIEEKNRIAAMEYLGRIRHYPRKKK